MRLPRKTWKMNFESSSWLLSNQRRTNPAKNQSRSQYSTIPAIVAGAWVWSSIPVKNQSRSQHSTWESNIWFDKDQHSTLQFNFVVLNAIVKTLDFNFISESSTLNYVHQHSILLINIALDTCAFRERWTLNHQKLVVELSKAYQSRHKSKLRLQLSSREFNIKCYVSTCNFGN